jgi:hypothetical protein
MARKYCRVYVLVTQDQRKTPKEPARHIVAPDGITLKRSEHLGVVWSFRGHVITEEGTEYVPVMLKKIGMDTSKWQDKWGKPHRGKKKLKVIWDKLTTADKGKYKYAVEVRLNGGHPIHIDPEVELEPDE